MGFTRPLRELFLRHKDIARGHAGIHDFWMYHIAVASGTARMLSNVPTTLYRRHESNFSNVFFRPKGNRIAWMWRLQQECRRLLSRQAKGFILASATLPSGQKLERILAIARLVATLDQRQSPAALFRLVRCGATWPSRRSSLWLAATCLCSNVKAKPGSPG
jgi:hypothetical protein